MITKRSRKVQVKGCAITEETLLQTITLTFNNALYLKIIVSIFIPHTNTGNIEKIIYSNYLELAFIGLAFGRRIKWQIWLDYGDKNSVWREERASGLTFYLLLLRTVYKQILQSTTNRIHRDIQINMEDILWRWENNIRSYYKVQMPFSLIWDIKLNHSKFMF